MEQGRLSELLADPGRITQGDIPALQALVNEHPYFQSARLLLLKGLHQEGSVYFDEAARTCAAHVPDRHVIYELTVQQGLKEKVLQVEAELVDEEGISTELTEIPTKERQEDLDKLERMIVSEALESTFSISDVPETRIEETTEINAQLEEKSDERSFLEWISGEPDESVKPVLDKRELVDAFLSKSLPEDKKTPFFSAVDMGKLSLVEDMSFVTETLARIYEKQGDLEKASKAYKHLSLKEPQKSTYFAARLKELEEKKNKK